MLDQNFVRDFIRSSWIVNLPVFCQKVQVYLKVYNLDSLSID